MTDAEYARAANLIRVRTCRQLMSEIITCDPITPTPHKLLVDALTEYEEKLANAVQADLGKQYETAEG